MTLLDAKKTLGFIGCGTMGEAIARGILRSGNLTPSQIYAADLRAEVAARLTADNGIRAGTDPLAVAMGCDVALVCVKPHQIAAALDNEAMRVALAGKLVISIAAGVRLKKLCAYLPKSAVIRAMPNTPALVGEGMSGLARGEGVSDEQMALAHAIFGSVGKAIEVDESHMDIITALAGSGPAFVFLMIEALADGAVQMGLRRDAALGVAAQMVRGAASMVLETRSHPAVLKDQVTTPGGCTIAGLGMMEDGKVRSVLARTIEETTRVAGKLG